MAKVRGNPTTEHASVELPASSHGRRKPVSRSTSPRNGPGYPSRAGERVETCFLR
jgi:hypothetical protein